MVSDGKSSTGRQRIYVSSYRSAVDRRLFTKATSANIQSEEKDRNKLIERERERNKENREEGRNKDKKR